MNSRINLYWYRHKDGQGNFGDELNPYIVQKLSGKKVNHIDINFIFDEKWLAVKTMIKALVERKISIGKFIRYFYYNFINVPQVILAIGSILESSQSSNNIVWGAGFINSNTTTVKGIFLAVRGNKTAVKLDELNIVRPKITGDPAILLPVIYQPKSLKTNKIGIIPHYQHYHSVSEKFSDEFLVINLLDNIEKVIDEIQSCKYTLSTSLHGIIVSHSYQVPSLWSDFPAAISHKLAGDNMKFSDYFSSVNIDDYQAIQIENLSSLTADKITKLFEIKSEIAMPSEIIIEKIQKNLLNVVPFEIIIGNCYRNYI